MTLTNKCLSNEKWLLLILLLIGIFHRSLLWCLYQDDLDALIVANSNWLTWQYLPIPALTEQLWESLWYLQQTPPLPHLILGLGLQVLKWPFEIAYFLIIVQTLLSLVTTVLLFRILCLLLPGYAWGHGLLSLLFMLNADLVVMEYNSFGQTFYENLAMALLTATVYLFLKLQQTRQTKYVVWLGLVVAGLALSRATYAYLFIIVLGFLGYQFASKIWRILLFAAIILLLHGGWVLKNYWVYDYVSVSTSSWKGGNFINGLIRVGYRDQLIQLVSEEPQYYSEWFIPLIKNHGLVVWWDAQMINNYLPPAIVKRDNRINQKLHGHHRPENSIAQRLLFDNYMILYQRFLLKYPELVWSKFLLSYGLFWQPIRNYGISFLDLFYVKPELTEVSLIEISKLLPTTPQEQQMIMNGPYIPISSRTANLATTPAQFYTIDLFSHHLQWLNLMVIHLIAPLLVLAILIRYVLGKPLNYQAVTLVFGMVIYAYAAVTFNLPEYGENMRFRLSVEPLIWVISITSVSHLLWILTQGHRHWWEQVIGQSSWVNQ